MKKTVYRSVCAIVFVAAMVASGMQLVRAQASNSGQANGFRISPVRSEITIEKGKTSVLTITLENPSDTAATARAIVNDFVPSDDESGEPRLILDDTAAPPKNDFKKLVPTIPDVALAPREKKDITITLTIPGNATSGGYYGAVRFTTISGNINQKNVGLTASVGTIVLVQVPGNLTEKLDLVQLSAAVKKKRKEGDTYVARSFFTAGDVSIMTRLKNNGDIHLKPFGKVIVKNMFGKTINEFEFNNTEPRANVLPGSVRRFTNDIPQTKWFGRYTVEANLGYRQGSGDLITSVATFWYIPTIALYGIILAIMGLVGAVYWFIRKQKAQRLHKHDVNKKKK